MEPERAGRPGGALWTQMPARRSIIIVCLLLSPFFWFLQKRESWGGGGLTALAPVAPASEKVAAESETLLLISRVSRPLDIFFLLINLLTPLYCVNWEWETLQMGIAANNR